MSNVELLPLPDEMCARLFKWAAVEEYARACVAHATAAEDAEIEALRAEVAKQSAYAKRTHDWNTELLANNERLAEALREVADYMGSRAKWEACDCGCPNAKRPVDAASVAWIRAAAMVRAALHPTAAQEGNE